MNCNFVIKKLLLWWISKSRNEYSFLLLFFIPLKRLIIDRHKYQTLSKLTPPPRLYLFGYCQPC